MLGGRSGRTWQSAVVSDEAGHVYVLLVDTQVLHAAHELPVANREVLREFGDASEEQGPGQVQRSETTEPVNVYAPVVLLGLYIINTNGGERMKNSSQREFFSVIFTPGDEKKDKHPSEGEKRSLANTLEMWNFISKQVYSLS